MSRRSWVVQASDAPGGGPLEDGKVPNSASGKTPDDTLSQLIRHGRDREAVELATEQVLRQPTGAPMDPISQLDAIVPLLDGLVATLDDDDLAKPTPCETFDVGQVLEHMVGGATVFAAAFRGTDPAPVDGPSDIRAAFPAAMADLLAAMRSPGALDQTIQAPFGAVPGEAFARFVALDGLVHGWDIATATGEDYEPPPAVVSAVQAFAAEAIQDGMRDGDTFALAVEPPSDASPLTRLVAFTGRRID